MVVVDITWVGELCCLLYIQHEQLAKSSLTLLALQNGKGLRLGKNKMQDSSEQHETESSTLTVNDVDVEFLPLIYEIIRSLEKDPHDNTQKTRDSQDTTQKILELQKKLERAREQIRKLPGIEYNKEEQLRQLDVLRNQLRLKRELLHKYRNMCTFEIPKA